MVEPVSSHSTPLDAIERLLIELHELIASGQGDSPEADALRESLADATIDAPPGLMQTLQGFSADLYMCSRSECLVPTPDGLANLESWRRELQRTFEHGNFARVLELMRFSARAIDLSMTSDRVAYIRARAYDSLGHRQAALKFMEFALKLAPSNANYESLVLHLVQQAGDTQTAVDRAMAIMNRANASPRPLIMATSILAKRLPDFTAPERARLAHTLKDRIKAAIQAEAASRQPLPRVLSLAYSLLALLYLREDKGVEALDALSLAANTTTNDDARLKILEVIRQTTETIKASRPEPTSYALLSRTADSLAQQAMEAPLAIAG